MADDGPLEGMGAEQPAEEPSLLEVEREKHRRRAEKFGTEYVDPSQRQDLRQEVRKEKFARPGFATGIDLFTEEEQQKLAARAERFGLQSAGLQYVPPVMPEDEAKKKARAQRFGVEYQPTDETGLMDVDLLEQRQDVNPEVPRRHEAVHVYGVDLMSTKGRLGVVDCLRYFADYGPTFVEWINDSCCNVLFRDGATAKRAVVGLGKPLPPDEMPDLQGLDAADPANIELLWYKGEDFVKEGTPIPLIFRIATAQDVKPAPGEGGAPHVTRRLWQQGGGGPGRGRGQPRYRVGRGGGKGRGSRQQQQDGDEWQQQGAGGEGGDEEGDVEMRQQRRGRGRRRHKRRREGDVEMGDAEGGEGGGEWADEGQGDPQQRPKRTAMFQEGSRRMFAAAFGGVAGGPAAAAAAAAGTPVPPPREQVDYGDL
ncbi:hypothetical protein N2152v2_004982 [Parachlorella kessleri]